MPIDSVKENTSFGMCFRVSNGRCRAQYSGTFVVVIVALNVGRTLVLMTPLRGVPPRIKLQYNSNKRQECLDTSEDRTTDK